MQIQKSARIESGLVSVGRCILRQLCFSSPDVDKVISAVLKSRGKLLRPAMLLAMGNENTERLINIAACAEIIHMASLVHDDIIDDATCRRGLPTIQSRFGKDIAVYAGDLMIARVMQTLSHLGATRALELFSQSISEMCAGEILQKSEYYNASVTIEQYVERINGKTAALFSAVCRVGALEGNADEETAAQYAMLGSCIGILFQIRDDLLDVCVPDGISDKPTQKDFLQGIYTMPAIYAFAHPETGERLRALAELKTSAGPANVEIHELIRASGGVDFTRRYMRNIAEGARTLLAELEKNEAFDIFDSFLGWVLEQ